MYVIEDTSSANEAPEQDDLAKELRTVVALRTKGRCRDGHGTLTHLFFSEDLYDIARAKAICAKCQVSALCLSTALDRQEPWGVWMARQDFNVSTAKPVHRLPGAPT